MQPLFKGFALWPLLVLACASPHPKEPPPSVPEPAITVPPREPKPEDPSSADGSSPVPVDVAAKRVCDESYGPALEPGAERNPQTLLEAAGCYEAAGAIGAAVKIWQLVVKEFPQSEAAPTALRSAGSTYERIGHVADAARYYEEFARRYPKREGAAELLKKALCYRASFDDANGVANDLAALEKDHATKATVAELCPIASGAAPEGAAP